MKGVETGGGDFISVCEPVVVVAYHLIIMKRWKMQVEILLLFVNPYYLIIMKEVERGGGDFTSLFRFS